jgi:hypothetical protein
MAHDVFISYSSKDKLAADACCAALEQRGIRCWMAPRDIVPGADWGEAIITAINGARALLLIFSSHANESRQIKREVERAVNRGLPILPMRIEDVAPAKSLEYFISTPHWLDAVTPPLERHIDHLCDVVAHILKGEPRTAERPAPAVRWHQRPRARLGAGIALLLAVLVAWLMTGVGSPPTFAGTWELQQVESAGADPRFIRYVPDSFFQTAFPGLQPTGSLEIEPLGQYRWSSSVEDKGRIAAGDGARPSFPLVGRYEFVSELTGKAIPVSTLYALENLDPAYGGKPGAGGFVTDHPMIRCMLLGKASEEPAPPAYQGIVGEWSCDAKTPGQGTTRNTVTIGVDGSYRILVTVEEIGLWEAQEGKWTRTPSGIQPNLAVPPLSGSYSFEDSDTLSYGSPSGTMILKREG